MVAVACKMRGDWPVNPEKTYLLLRINRPTFSFQESNTRGAKERRRSGLYETDEQLTPGNNGRRDV